MFKHIKKRIRLYKICKALNIKLHRNQKDFILRKSNNIIYGGRQNGKTTSINIRLLLEDVGFDVWVDCDFIKNKLWHIKNFNEMYEMCVNNGIKFKTKPLNINKR